ncbi:MAG: metallophosphoesterase [bacterium]|nr:metallophosphoesterase [bacterium]
MGFIKKLALTAGIALAVKGLDMRLEVVHYRLSSKKLPKEFDGLRIMQLSDYHSDTVPGLLEAVRSEEPDLIFTTGDMADDKGSYLPAVRLFRQLAEIAPVFAISGNHEVWRNDYEEFVSDVISAGVTVLRDETVIISCGDAEITLSGIEDPFSRDGLTMKRNVRASLDRLSIDKSMYNILLFHRANMFDTIRGRGFDLILAGHMHGGQFRLPTGRGLVSPKSSMGSDNTLLFPKYFGGRYEHNGTTMLVNRGLGNPMVIPRLFNRPEVTLITLHCK